VKAGFSALLFDLLTPDEDRTYDNRFDIELLTRRLKAATLLLGTHPKTSGLALGYFGASTGTASALRAASEPGTGIKAIVSRGGRPDLAGDALSRVRVPVLLIVGGLDHPVIDLNRQAYELLGGEKEVAIVPGATHLFEEPGALDEVARMASRWFTRHLLRGSG
jgi:pimeloyl-ACP methyl ester carboxylesterase